MADGEGRWGAWYGARLGRLRLEVLEIERDLRRARPARRRSIHRWRVDALGRDGAPLDPGEPLRLSKDLRARGDEIADELARELGCTPSSAFEWLVYGAPPQLPPLLVEMPESRSGNQTWGMVTLNVPIELPPSSVEMLYAEARAAVIERIAENAPSVVEGTPISLKAQQATLFAAERADSGMSWQEVYDAWSAEHDPRFSYANRSAFIDAVRKTYRRLMGRDLEWSRKPGRRRGGEGDVD